MDWLEEPLTRWTIRLSLALAVAALWRIGRDPGRANHFAAARWLWSAAWVLFVSHVVCAFAFYHGWSHAAAWQATARDTAAVFNVDWGGGLLVNYALLLCWTIDVGQLWLAPHSARRRPRWLLIAWYGCCIAISFFATVVFEAGLTRMLGLAFTAFSLVIAAKALARKH